MAVLACAKLRLPPLPSPWLLCLRSRLTCWVNLALSLRGLFASFFDKADSAVRKFLGNFSAGAVRTLSFAEALTTAVCPALNTWIKA